MTSFEQRAHEANRTPASAFTVHDLLSRLDGVRDRGNGQWLARCPAHDDRSPSLSIKETSDGTILIHCFALCSPGDIVAAMGMDLADLFPKQEGDIGAPLPAGRAPRWNPKDLLLVIRDEALAAAQAVPRTTPESRNADNPIEQLRALLGPAPERTGPCPWELYRDWLWKCREAGEPVCFETGQPISGREIHQIRRYTWVPVLKAIDHEQHKKRHGRDFGVIVCPNCGSIRKPRMTRDYYGARRAGNQSKCCSAFCQKQLHKRKQKPSPRPCQECGDTYSPPRHDSKYCSNACRQKAYRQRVTDSRGGVAATSSKT